MIACERHACRPIDIDLAVHTPSSTDCVCATSTVDPNVQLLSGDAIAGNQRRFLDYVRSLPPQNRPAFWWSSLVAWTNNLSKPCRADDAPCSQDAGEKAAILSCMGSDGLPPEKIECKIVQFEASNQKSKYAYRKIFFYKKALVCMMCVCYYFLFITCVFDVLYYCILFHWFYFLILPLGVQ